MLGHQILNSAAHRAHSDDDLMTRAMYIDALKYLHSGLPADISESERQSLHAFLPALESESSSQSSRNPHRTDQDVAPRSKLVQSSIASIVAFLIALFMLAMPMLATIANRLIDYERKHHVTERLANATGHIVRVASTKSLTISGQIISVSQRQMSAYALISVLGLVHSIVDGVSDGVERSLQTREITQSSGDTRRLPNS